VRTLSFSRYEIPALALLSALLTATVFLTTTRIMPGTEQYELGVMDHHRYVMMAEGNPFDFHLAPFSWRVLVPLIVKLQPFGTDMGFLLVTLVSMWLCGIMVYYMIKAAGFDRVYGLFGMLLFFSIGWVTKQYVYDFRLTDLPAILFIVAAIYAIYSKRDLLFLVLLTVGVFAKETVLFAAPLYYSLNAAKMVDLRLLRRTMLLALPPVVVLVLLRLGIPALNGDPAYTAIMSQKMTLAPDYEKVPYSFVTMLNAFGAERIQKLTLYNVGLRYVLFPLSLVPVALPLLAIKQVAIVLLRFSPYLILVYAQLLIAKNTERLVALAFPALIVMSVVAVQKVMTDLRINPLWALVLPASLFVLGTVSSDPEWSYLSLNWQFVIFVFFLLFLASVFIYRNGEKRVTRQASVDNAP
jgi:hypothetical protein